VAGVSVLPAAPSAVDVPSATLLFAPAVVGIPTVVNIPFPHGASTDSGPPAAVVSSLGSLLWIESLL
jgi:hypothetical protein